MPIRTLVIGSFQSHSLTAKAKPPALAKPIDIGSRKKYGSRMMQIFANRLVALTWLLLNQIALVEDKGKIQNIGAEFASCRATVMDEPRL